MKKILIFIGLKLAEILGVCGIIGIIYGLGLIGNTYIFRDDVLWFIIFLEGLLTLAIPWLVFLIYYGIYHAIKANWAWADRIAKK